MLRMMRGVALGAAVLLAAGACNGASADTAGNETPESDKAGGEGDFGAMYYVAWEGNGTTDRTSRLLRWDGEGDVETVYEQNDIDLFNTAVVGDDDGYAVFAQNEQLVSLDLDSNEETVIADYPDSEGDDCRAIDMAPGDPGKVGMGGFDADNVALVDIASGEAIGEIDASACQPQLATEDSTQSLMFTTDYSSKSITFMAEDGRHVDTEVGQTASDLIGETEYFGLSEVSPSGSQVCVSNDNTGEGERTSPYLRSNVCHALFDVATGEQLQYFDGDYFTVRYTAEGLMLRKDGELSYYPSADKLSDPAQTLSEPDELAEAQLVAVTNS